jgi:hypothetical protein
MVLRLSGLCTTMIANFVTASGRNCIAEGSVLLESSPADGITCPAEKSFSPPTAFCTCP